MGDVEDKTALSVNQDLAFFSNLAAGRLKLIIFVILFLIIIFNPLPIPRLLPFPFSLSHYLLLPLSHPGPNPSSPLL